MSSAREVLCLYKSMLREGRKFSSYNFREYAYRRIQHGFKSGSAETNPEEVNKLLHQAHESLVMLRRQVIISSLYANPKLVIEE